MSSFSLFAILYMSAFFLEMADGWRYPAFTIAIFLLMTVVIRTGVTRTGFLVFLVLSTAHLLLFRFPDVANHNNLIIYCNLVMLAGMAYALVRRERFPTDEDYFSGMRPLLASSLAIVYFLAGFHKLNADFVNPDVSCAAWVLGAASRPMRSWQVAGPMALILLAGGGVVTYRLLLKGRSYGRAAVAVCITLLSCTAVLVMAPAAEATARAWPTLATAAGVSLWELVGGALLAVPQLQPPILLFSWAMQSILAMVGFVDFGALALALLFAFLPRPYAQLLSVPARLRPFGLEVQRAHLYFILTAIGGILAGIHFHLRRLPNFELVAGALFNLSALVLAYPVLAALLSRAPPPRWEGTVFVSRRTPRLMLMFPLLLCLHGMTSYLGLRTAGNFSMFSNLRTEGERSNHFLLRNNPLKVWGYQEDTVRFIRINDALASIGYAYEPLEGNLLPVVEFRKLIYRWTKAGYRVPMTFEYRGTIHSTEDIVKDPVWRTDKRNWEMTLMDFRVIQPDGPNRCRW